MNQQPYYPYPTALQQPYGYPMYNYRFAANTAPAATGGVPNIPSGTTIPGTVPGAAPGAVPSPGTATPPGLLALEESYIENILRANLGKLAVIYMTFENNTQWNAKVFKGRLEAAGRDHIIISDPKTGMRHLLLMVNLDYITFDDPLNYTYPFQAAPTTR